METLLYEGTFYSLYRYNTDLIKRFRRRHYFHQELTVLQALHEADAVIKLHTFDEDTLTLRFASYDTTLRELKKDLSLNLTTKLKIIEHVLIGLKQIHERGFIHNEVKDGNIFIRTSDYSAILGISPLTDLSERAQCDRTPKVYREPHINHNSSHDMYSVGIWLLQFLGDITLNRSPNTLDELFGVIDTVITDENHRNLIRNLVREDQRYNVDQVLDCLYPWPLKEPEI